MTEEEAKKALFEIHHFYMSHTPEVRDQIVDEYKAAREKIKRELAKAILNRREEKFKLK